MEYTWKLQHHEMRGNPIRVKHLQIMKAGRRFADLFGPPIQQFYTDFMAGFDILAFDEWLMMQDEQYAAANAGDLGPDANCSMADHIKAKYGEEASDLISAII